MGLYQLLCWMVEFLHTWWIEWLMQQTSQLTILYMVICYEFLEPYNFQFQVQYEDIHHLFFLIIRWQIQNQLFLNFYLNYTKYFLVLNLCDIFLCCWHDIMHPKFKRNRIYRILLQKVLYLKHIQTILLLQLILRPNKICFLIYLISWCILLIQLQLNLQCLDD